MLNPDGRQRDPEWSSGEISGPWGTSPGCHNSEGHVTGYTLCNFLSHWSCDHRIGDNPQWYGGPGTPDVPGIGAVRAR
ncbi:hypothetical protein GCM10025762_07790 [Haloechinothrix salitolerans]